MDSIVRGVLPREKRDTAPPWSGAWPMFSGEADGHRPSGIGGDASGSLVDPAAIGTSFTRKKAPNPVDRNKRQQEESEADQRKKKLFVGMAPKSAYEEDYRVVFSPFGNPLDIYVIRDRNGFSKGCAFVKYSSVESANDAIEALHDKYIMPGGFRTLVVTVADDRRTPNNRVSCDSAADVGCSQGSTSPLVLEGDSEGGRNASWHNLAAQTAPITASRASYGIPGSLAQPSIAPGVPYVFCGGGPPQGTFVYYPYVGPTSYQSPPGSAELDVRPHHAFTVAAMPGPTVPCDARVGAVESAAGTSRQPQNRSYSMSAEGPKSRAEGMYRCPRNVCPEKSGRRWAKQHVGPSGANLFVYYLPGSLSDADLASAFAPFGKVLSAKVYYDRDTGESKGFGFVSYANPDHADAAIARMNGYFVGQKRLKVVRKRGQQRGPDIDGLLRDPGQESSNGDVSRGSTPCSASNLGKDGSIGVLGRSDLSSSGKPGDRGSCEDQVGDAGGQRDFIDGSQPDVDFLNPEVLLGHSMSMFL